MSTPKPNETAQESLARTQPTVENSAGVLRWDEARGWTVGTSPVLTDIKKGALQIARHRGSR